MKHHLTPSEAEGLETLEALWPCTIAELALELSVTRQRAHKIVKTLEKKGWIRRHPPGIDFL